MEYLLCKLALCNRWTIFALPENLFHSFKLIPLEIPMKEMAVKVAQQRIQQMVTVS